MINKISRKPSVKRIDRMIHQLDKTDVEILKLLQHNADLSNKQIAYQLNKSVATIQERIRRLKEDRYIRKTVALLDPAKVNRSLIAFSHVLLCGHAFETLNQFETAVTEFPEVMECFQMAGTIDFMLRVVTADMNAYHEFYRNKLSTLPNIATVQSFFVISETKSETAYPLQVKVSI